MTMKKTDKKSSFGMLSVKAGIDNNPNPTHADRIAGAKMKPRKQKKVRCLEMAVMFLYLLLITKV